MILRTPIMDPPALWRGYFDNPTFSDVTIRLSDRVVHVHRIVLCREFEYLETLAQSNNLVRPTLTGYQESGSSELSLHDDDPRTAVELLRFICGVDFDESHEESMGEMQFLATTYVTAAKYQLEGLKGKLR